MMLVTALTDVSLDAGCEAFLTNDRMLLRVTDLRVLVLDDLEI